MTEPPAPSLEEVLARPESGPRATSDVALGRDRSRPPVLAPSRPPTVRNQMKARVHSRPTPVPRPDWEKILAGSKRMFRSYSASWRDRFAPLFPAGEVFPRPVVIYSQTGHARQYDAALAVVTAYRMELLGDISATDLFLEGFESLREYRWYWGHRYRRWGWRPGDMVSVVELRPWEEQDDEEQAAWLLRQLYGKWL